MITEILLGLSTVVNVVLGIGVYNLLKQNQQLDDMIIGEREYMHDKLTDTLETLRSIDENGSFESDDEVGATFTDIINAINELQEKI